MFLQRWIDAAWQAGFDREGAIQLGGSLAGTSTWVGPSEGYALASFMGLRSQVVQINTPHPADYKRKKDIQERPSDAHEGQKLLGSFLWRYFSTPWESFSLEKAGA